jgi:hypothetical protein
MNLILLLLLIFAAVIDFHKAPIKKFPFFATLHLHTITETSIQCFGAIVSTRHILTPMYACKSQPPQNPWIRIISSYDVDDYMSAYVNFDNRKNRGLQEFKILHFHHYPVSTHGYRNIDVQLIEIDGKFLDVNVIPIAVSRNRRNKFVVTIDDVKKLHYERVFFKDCKEWSAEPNQHDLILTQPKIIEVSEIKELTGLKSMQCEEYGVYCYNFVCLSSSRGGMPLVQFNKVLNRYELLGISLYNNIKRSLVHVNLLYKDTREWVRTHVTN